MWQESGLYRDDTVSETRLSSGRTEDSGRTSLTHGTKSPGILLVQLETWGDDGKPDHGTEVDCAHATLEDAIRYESDIEKTQC